MPHLKLLQELRYGHDRNAIVESYSKQVFVTRHDAFGMSRLSAFQDLVVVGIILDHVEDHGRHNWLGDREECSAGFGDPVFWPTELPAQRRFDFVEDLA